MRARLASAAFRFLFKRPLINEREILEFGRSAYGVPHGWQILTATVPEAGESLDTAASFLRSSVRVPATVAA